MHSHERWALAAMLTVSQVPDVVSMILSNYQVDFVSVLRDKKVPMSPVSIWCCFRRVQRVLRDEGRHTSYLLDLAASHNHSLSKLPFERSLAFG